MSTITVKRATGKDAGLIADMSRQTFYETFARHNTTEDMDKFMNEQFTRERLMDEVGEPDNYFLIAYNDDVAVGYARLRKATNPPALGDAHAIEIARIYAIQNQIGKGIGSSLMQECISLAQHERYEVIWLGVWEKNQKAIDFYTRWGFEKFGDHEFVLGNDVQTDWLMKKLL